MRAACLIGFGLLLVSATLGYAESTTPYEVLVNEPGLDVRSGPGSTCYVTDHVPANTRLEVYRSEPGGWLGIRPPEGSYSWVRKDQLRPTKTPGVSKVAEEGAICRIGSRVVTTPEHVCQVSLQQGELVEVLEEQQAADAAGSNLETWCRIAPPAGEFRWILARELVSAKRDTRPAPEPAAKPDAWTPRRGLASGAVAGAAPAATAATPITAGTPRETVTIAEPTATIRVPASPPATAEATAAAKPPAAIVELPTAPASAPMEPTWLARDKSPHENLEQLELELSRQVSQELRTWRLEPLRKRVEAVTGQLDSAADKQAAAELLRRIRQFEDLENRIVQAESAVPPGTTVASSGGTPPTANIGPRFDGSGWLVAVHSTTHTAPPYALLNAEGDVLQYVYPSPGLNLHRYERKQVGVYGQRGLNTTLNKPALTAERIVDIDRHLR